MKSIILPFRVIYFLLLCSTKLLAQPVKGNPTQLDSLLEIGCSVNFYQAQSVIHSDSILHRSEHFVIEGLISLGDAYLEENNQKEAKSIIDSVRKYISFYRMYDLNSDLYLLMSRYYAQTGDLQSSTLYMDSSLEIQNEEYQKQYNIASIHEIENRLTLGSLSKEVQLNLFLSFFSLIVIASTFYFLYARNNKRGNRILYKRIIEAGKLQTELTETKQRLLAMQQQNVEPEKTHQPIVKENSNNGLVQRLEDLMRTEQLFINPSLTRKILAERLHTNENYLASAIRNGHNGQTFSDYINSLRLEYAHHLLITKPELSIKEITNASGFPSYKYFHKLFHEEFGISPSKFKEMTKNKKFS